MNEYLRGHRNQDKQMLKALARGGDVQRKAISLEATWVKTKTRRGSKEAQAMNERWIGTSQAVTKSDSPIVDSNNSVTPRDSGTPLTTREAQVDQFLLKRGVRFS
jgi:hypothetical protein